MNYQSSQIPADSSPLLTYINRNPTAFSLYQKLRLHGVVITFSTVNSIFPSYKIIPAGENSDRHILQCNVAGESSMGKSLACFVEGAANLYARLVLHDFHENPFAPANLNPTLISSASLEDGNNNIQIKFPTTTSPHHTNELLSATYNPSLTSRIHAIYMATAYQNALKAEAIFYLLNDPLLKDEVQDLAASTLVTNNSYFSAYRDEYKKDPLPQHLRQIIACNPYEHPPISQLELAARRRHSFMAAFKVIYSATGTMQKLASEEANRHITYIESYWQQNSPRNTMRVQELYKDTVAPSVIAQRLFGKNDGEFLFLDQPFYRYMNDQTINLIKNRYLMTPKPASPAFEQILGLPIFSQELEKKLSLFFSQAIHRPYSLKAKHWDEMCNKQSDDLLGGFDNRSPTAINIMDYILYRGFTISQYIQKGESSVVTADSLNNLININMAHARSDRFISFIKRGYLCFLERELPDLYDSNNNLSLVSSIYAGWLAEAACRTVALHTVIDTLSSYNVNNIAERSQALAEDIEFRELQRKSLDILGQDLFLAYENPQLQDQSIKTDDKNAEQFMQALLSCFNDLSNRQVIAQKVAENFFASPITSDQWQELDFSLLALKILAPTLDLLGLKASDQLLSAFTEEVKQPFYSFISSYTRSAISELANQQQPAISHIFDQLNTPAHLQIQLEALEMESIANSNWKLPQQDWLHIKQRKYLP
ncbi:MAG: hypothetical protein ACOYK8_00330 [Alphaproteobacteria bacterium]